MPLAERDELTCQHPKGGVCIQVATTRRRGKTITVKVELLSAPQVNLQGMLEGSWLFHLSQFVRMELVEELIEVGI